MTVFLLLSTFVGMFVAAIFAKPNGCNGDGELTHCSGNCANRGYFRKWM